MGKPPVSFTLVSLVPRAPCGVIALPHYTAPWASDVRFQFNKPAEAEADRPLTKDGMKHQGILDVDGRGRHPTVSDGCLVLVATCVKVTSSSGPPTPFYILITGVWGSFVPEDAHWKHTEPSRTHGDHFLSCVKRAQFPKTVFGTGNQIRDDGEATQVSLMRAHRE
jgi:hypothetical protein